MGPIGFEGEALLVWGRYRTHPVGLAAVHHPYSPVGPFVELVAGELGPSARRWTVAVGAGAPGAPGFPGAPGAPGFPEGAETAMLKWWASGSLREVIWEERGLRLQAEAFRTGVPASVPVRWLHPGWADTGGGDRRADRLHGWLTLARVEVEVPPDDALALFAGRRSGLLFSSVRLAVGGARLLLPRPARVFPAPALAEPA
jgi:hypothetical protein